MKLFSEPLKPEDVRRRKRSCMQRRNFVPAPAQREERPGAFTEYARTGHEQPGGDITMLHDIMGIKHS